MLALDGHGENFYVGEALAHVKAWSTLHSKRKLAILKEREKNGVKAVSAKYGISDQTHRVWRYKIKGIEPKKQFPIKKKREILEQGFRTASSKFAPLTGSAPELIIGGRYRWKKLGFAKSLRHSFT